MTETWKATMTLHNSLVTARSSGSVTARSPGGTARNGKSEPGWQAFLRQYNDFLQLVLLAAAAANVIVTGDWSTTLIILAATVFNALMGVRQESKFEEDTLAALGKAMTSASEAGAVGRAEAEGPEIEVWMR